MDALIVGAGDIGRWFADRVEWRVAFADVNPEAAAVAAEAVGERGSVADIDADTEFDVVVVAVPMRAATETIETHGTRANTALVDLTGSMRAPLAAMAATAPDVERASLHPLFAPERAPGRVALSIGSDGPTVSTIRDRLEGAGNEIVAVEPEVHDRAMETIQGRTHAAILAFGLAAEAVPRELATPVFEDLQALRERVTGGSPGVYADIQETFDGAADVATAAERLARADREDFEVLYDDAG